MYKTLSITSDLFWLGALDPELRVFDIIMRTEFGTSYNAYLLKTTEGMILFETVKDKFFEDYLNKLKTLVDLKEITYIVVNHTEPDHAGSVAKLLKYVPDATVVGSALAIKYISQMINAPFKSKVVKEGDRLSLGNKTVRFISAPCLHWPDTMYSYIEQDKVLMTCDSFGAHYCDERVLKSALEEDKEQDFVDAYKYYFDMIMGPFKPFVQSALQKIKGLEMEYICPGHGLVLDHQTMSKYIALYEEWSTPVKRKIPSIVIPYVSAYGYTKELAMKIEEGIKKVETSVEVLAFDLVTSEIQDVISAINEANGLLLGSPTLLGDALPPIWQILGSLNPVIHKGLTAGCFGSYGWSGEALKHIEERLAQIKCNQPLPPFGIVFKPSEEDLEKAITFGYEFAKHALK